MAVNVSSEVELYATLRSEGKTTPTMAATRASSKPRDGVLASGTVAPVMPAEPAPEDPRQRQVVVAFWPST